MDSSDVEQLKKNRLMFLHRLYEETGGNRQAFVNLFEFGERLGYDRDLTRLVVQYLEGEGLVESVAQAVINITHLGVLEVEGALSKPDTPTTHFPPFNIIIAGQIIDSSIQQASPGAVASITVSPIEHREAILKAVEQAIGEILAATDVPGLNKDEVVETLEEVRTEANKDQPNGLRLRSLFIGAATAISNIANLGSTYQVLKGAASLLGINLP